MKKKEIGRFHVITDDVIQKRFSHVELARMAIAGGADTIQYRDKRRGAREQIKVAQAIRDLCSRAGVCFIVNDRPDIALAVDADGVHLGRSDLPIAVARRLLGPDKIIGGTGSTREDAKRVRTEGADYMGLGHIYPTRTKKKSGPPIGLEKLAKICQKISFPIIAVGGVDVFNLSPVLGTGVWGVAASAAVCASDDPEVATGEMQSIISSSRGRPVR
jgi:thiamine-phosphate pyrophosphorylase